MSDSQLFANLALQAGRQFLTRLELAAGEFPQPAQQPLRRALGDQDLLIAADHRRGDKVVRYWAAFAGITGRCSCTPRARAWQNRLTGQLWQSGARGVQMVAPRSISAWL